MKRYIDTFFRYWFIAIVPVLILPLVGLATGYKAGQTQAIASIWVGSDTLKQLDYTNSFQTPAQNMQAGLQQLMTSATFDVRVAKSVPGYWAPLASLPPAIAKGRVTADLSTHTVVVATGPTFLSVAYVSKNPAVGAQIVQAILQQAPQEFERLNNQQIQKNIADDKQQLKAAKARLLQATTAFGTYITDHNIPLNQVSIQEISDPSLGNLYQNTQSAQVDVRNAQQQLSQDQQQQQQAMSSFRVVDPPTAIISSPSKKKLLMTLLEMLVAGLVLACAFVIARTLLDRSLRFSSDAADLIGLPVLMQIQKGEDAGSGVESGPVSIQERQARAARA